MFSVADRVVSKSESGHKAIVTLHLHAVALFLHNDHLEKMHELCCMYEFKAIEGAH